MSLRDWMDNAVERYRRDGVAVGTYGAIQELWEGGLGIVGEHVYNYGTPVWDLDWDVLLVLDTCRPDVLREVADEYHFLTGYDPGEASINSIGSRSPEWVRKTFDPDRYADELSRTAYVSANPHTRDIPDPDALYLLDEVWKYGWDTEWGNVHPDTITDRGIAVAREHDVDRLVMHYMQPHAPYREIVKDHPDWFSLTVGMDNPEDRPDINLWERFRTGRVSRDDLWPAYRDTLRWVLDSVETFLANADAETVAITSDHGEAFGEWWYYGHSTTAPIPPLKRVPWATTSATDSGEYEPTVEPEEIHVGADEVEQRLKTLGYV